ncbi:MAG TPA: signal peptidase I [Candidatus Eremiobacteraceae bacterium]|nr:signal peptidase I [Candidatus Eremiobacteraceae bacterium]
MLPQPAEPASYAGRSVTEDTEFDGEIRRTALLRKIRHASALTIEALVLLALLALFLVRVPQVDGHSMAPQIDAGDHVVIDTVAYALRIDRPGGGAPLADVLIRPVARSDVVAFSLGVGDARRIYLKRVIGLPGESVSIERGVVAIDGRPLVEPYGPARDADDMKAAVVPPDSLFVLGDNRGDSDDSRSFGPVPIAAVVGKAAFVLWPPGRVRAIH